MADDHMANTTSHFDKKIFEDVPELQTIRNESPINLIKPSIAREQLSELETARGTSEAGKSVKHKQMQN